MKKLILLIIFCIGGLSGLQNLSAQLAGSNLFSEKGTGEASSYQENVFAVDFGVGGWNRAGAAFDLGVRYLYNFSPYVGWDAIGMKIMTGINLGDCLFQFMTGIRATTPEFSKISVYTNVRLGYGASVEKDGGFCVEAGIGLNFAKRWHTGYVFDHSNDRGAGLRAHSLQIGYNF